MGTLTKRTYNLPADVMEEFDRQVPSGKRGAAITQAVKKWLEYNRLEEIRARIDEGLADADNEALYLEVEREWAPLSDELWARLPAENWPEPAVVWPQGLAVAREKHGGK